MDNSQTETLQFEEDGETIQMEINDGGTARAKFESEQEYQSELEDSDDTENEINNGPDSSQEHEVSVMSEGQVTESESETEQGVSFEKGASPRTPKQKTKKK